jgi:rod shape-determining protein MreC
MVPNISRHRHTLVYLFLILLPIAALNTSRKKPTELLWSDRLVLFITAPIQHGITNVMQGANQVVQEYLFLVQTESENQFLLEENQRLRGKLSEFEETVNENQRLRKLLAFEKSFPYDKVTAQVIARDPQTAFRSLRINKGSNSGVRRNMPVVTHEGVVGRILHVTGRTATVLTILDSQHAVDSLIQRTRTRGIVEGVSKHYVQMNYTLRTADVKEGDRVVTSGLGGVFPKGTSVGDVSFVEKKTYGVTQTIHLKPSVDFSKLEEVVVLLMPEQMETQEVSSSIGIRQPGGTNLE